jgi:NAD(P)H-dependent flavin oxidoreductase YrpB (nitropropane dioxygenase family)
MAHPALHTALCDLVGVQYPIVQTGMGWVASARLTAGTANAGGLGIIASATLDFKELADAIARVKDRTDKPFGVNLRSDAPDVFERAELMVKEGVKVASFALAPNEALMKRLKDAGLICIPSIGAARHAEKVAAWGADCVIVQGAEAGGHTGAVATTVLLPQVVDAVDIPVVAAGGFFDGRGLVAALSYGAAGIAMGTRFLMTRDSPVPDHIKEFYLKTPVTGTVVTTQVDGQPNRVLRTPFIDRLEGTNLLTSLPRAVSNAFRFRKLLGSSWGDYLREGLAMKRSGGLSWSQMVMAANAPMLFKASMVDGSVESGVMAGGQVSGLIDEIPSCDELVGRIVEDAGEILTRFGSAGA